MTAATTTHTPRNNTTAPRWGPGNYATLFISEARRLARYLFWGLVGVFAVVGLTVNGLNRATEVSAYQIGQAMQLPLLVSTLVAVLIVGVSTGRRAAWLRWADELDAGLAQLERHYRLINKVVMPATVTFDELAERTLRPGGKPMEPDWLLYTITSYLTPDVKEVRATDDRLVINVEKLRAALTAGRKELA